MGELKKSQVQCMERDLRRIRIQSRFLGAAALILAGALAFSGFQKKQAESSSSTYSAMQAYQSTGQAEAENEYSTTDQKLLVLVNKDHQIPADYEVNLHWLQNGSCAVADEMYDALKDMLTDGSVNGRQFVVASGYRDGARQQELLEEDIQASMINEGLTWQEAYDKETRETMPPGYSEHETGLAVDIVSLDYQILDELQETTAENQWLREHCSEYGFILRYPRGSEEITGIDYESWHFRYVGLEAAKEITRRGITLEEYLEAE